MSIGMDRNNLNRLNREIAELRSSEAAEIKKEAEATKKMNRAVENAGKASSSSMSLTYKREAEREAKNIEASQSRRSHHSAKIASKSREASRIQERIAAAEAMERKKVIADSNKQQREYSRNQKLYESRIRDLESQILALTPTASADLWGIAEDAYDFFISHASEDKEDFVAELAEKSRSAGLKVWYDNYTLEWGDNLRQKIDEGLSKSYFGIVVLSASFFAKKWPSYELDGLVQKEMLGTGRILPIWHKVTVDDVAKYSPSLTGRLALNTSVDSIDKIVEELAKKRDKLKSLGDSH